MQKIIFYILLISSLKAYSQVDSDTSYFSTPVITVTTNKLITKKDDSPSAIQLFNKETIEKTNGSQLSDVLKYANNIYIKSYGGNSSLKTISFNGLNSEHTIILLNGFKLNSYQNAQFDLSLIQKNDIESIEVTPSGNSATYGSEAVSGIVNIKLSDYSNSKKIINATLSAEQGSYSLNKFNLSINTKYKNSNLNLSGSIEKSNDNFDFYYNEGNEFIKKKRENNSYRKNNLLLQYSYSKDDMNLSSMSYYNETNRDIPGIETGSEPSKTNQKDKNWNTIISFEKGIKNNLLKINFNYQNNLMNYIPFQGLSNYYKNKSYSISPSFQYNLKDIKLLTGIEYNNASIESDNIDGLKQRNNYVFYSSNEIRILNNLIFYPSFRLENISDVQNFIPTYKIGLNYKPFNDGSFIFRSAIGNSYRSPTFNELYWKEGGNSKLEPEKSLNFEAGIQSYFHLLLNNSFEFNYYYIDSYNKIIWHPINSFIWSPINLSKSYSSIFSISWNTEMNINKKVKLDFGINYTKTFSIKNSEDYPNDNTKGNQLIYIPEDMFKFNFNFRYSPYEVNIFGNYYGKRYSDFENKEYLPQNFVLDANAGTTIDLRFIKMSLKFEVNNLLNENYQLISGYPMPLRNYNFILTLKY